MKAIVTSWIYPHEMPSNSDDRPKSIERISTSIEDVRQYMKISASAFGTKCEFADNLFHLNLRDSGDICPFEDMIESFYNGNGYSYLEECLRTDTLGQCVCRLYIDEETKKEDAHYFLFQVRNIH